MKTATVVPPWPDINLHCISSISTLCLTCLCNMHSNTLINCLIIFKPLIRTPLCLCSYCQFPSVLTLEIMLQIRSNTSTVPVSQMHVVYSIWMTIADDMSALSERILLIVFVIIPVLISWLVLQLCFTLACLLHSKEFEFE